MKGEPNPHIRSNHKYIQTLGSTRRRSEQVQDSQSLLESILTKVSEEDRDEIRGKIAKSDSEEISFSRLAFPKRKTDRRNTINHVQKQVQPQEQPNRPAKRRNTLIDGKQKTPQEFLRQYTRNNTLLPLDEVDSPSYYISEEPEYIRNNPYLMGYSDIISEVQLPDMEEFEIPDYRLYIGGLAAANDISKLHQYQIQAILTVGEENTPIHYPLITNGYGMIQLSDDSNARLGTFVPEICRFLNMQLNKGNVLVHCLAGVSRSCAAVASYFIKEFGLPDNEAVKLVEQSRECCMISEKLRKQLQGIRKLSPIRRRKQVD